MTADLALPAAFVAFNRRDPAWLRALPDLLGRLAERWSLRMEPHFPEIRINYVAPATRADGTACVLKVSRYLDEIGNEIAALRLWDGSGAARLLEVDEELGALLLERIEPGTMLVGMSRTDDDGATMVAAGMLRRLWRPAPAESGLRSLESWCAAYDCNREGLTRGEAGFPSALFQRADALRRDLLASTQQVTVLHGDTHHFNILRSDGARRAGRGRRGSQPGDDWLAIDPKGLSGDRHFDVCQFFRNPERVPVKVNTRRLDIFCAELGLDRRRTKDWCLVHGILDACWDFEDGNPWQDAVAYAEQTQSF